MHLVEEALGECIMIKTLCQLSNVFHFVIDILVLILDLNYLQNDRRHGAHTYSCIHTNNHVKCSHLCQADFKAGFQPQHRETSFSVPVRNEQNQRKRLGKSEALCCSLSPSFLQAALLNKVVLQAKNTTMEDN